MKKIKFILIAILSIALLLAGCGEDKAMDKAETEAAQPEQNNTVDKEKLQEAVEAYHEFGLEQADIFVTRTEEFVNAVKEGNVEKAKKLYPEARMPFERIEPIGESMGELDPKIDARENDVPQEEWSGYHRIEKALWVDNSTENVQEYADQLLSDVKSLRAKIELVDVSAQMLVTGSVDLLNEVSSTKITGEEDRYSHTDLYDFAANVQGAEKIFNLLMPVIEEQDEALASNLEQRFDDVFTALNEYKNGDSYMLYTELTKEDTQKLSKSIDALAEPLSQIGVVLGG